MDELIIFPIHGAILSAFQVTLFGSGIAIALPVYRCLPVMY